MNFKKIKSILSTKTVGIAGAGGLGSNCAAALVRIGLGNLVIVDFDKIEESNLNRQFYFRDQLGEYKVDALKKNLLRINPELNIITFKLILNIDNIPDIFKDVDVLVEAFDQADQKEMLIETALYEWPAKPLIIGSGMAGVGKIETIKIKKYDNLYICGDEMEEIGPDKPPLAPRVGIVSHMQADTALEILLNS